MEIARLEIAVHQPGIELRPATNRLGGAGTRREPSSPAPWSSPVEVRYEDDVGVSYQARVDGTFLVIRAIVASGWHTSPWINKRPADEDLAGKPALSVDKATEIEPLAGIGVSGPWYQSQPKDFSRSAARRAPRQSARTSMSD
jgi:hypothetical protein